MSRSRSSKNDELVILNYLTKIDDAAADHCRNLLSQIPKLIEYKDFSRRLACHERDLIYLGQYAPTEEAKRYCVELSLKLNFNAVMENSILSEGITANDDLIRRVGNLMDCHGQTLDIIEPEPDSTG